MKAIKKIMVLFLLVICSSALYAQEFVSPIGFVDIPENRQKVIAYIKKKASAEPALQGISEPALRRHYQLQIDAFKELAKVKNTTLLQQIIKSTRMMGMDNYVIILTMYTQSDHSYVPPFEWD